MVFSNFNLEKRYTTEGDKNPATTFYTPVLSESVLYQRIAGYFSSSSFAFIGEGLHAFIENGGKMQFIFNVQLLEDDYYQIEMGLSYPEKILESKFLSDLNTIEDECIKNHAKILGWLLAKEILEIKIGYLEQSPEGITPILHQKSGVFVDKAGNKIAFNGSNNESAMGWAYNSESFYVFCGWKSGQADYVEEIQTDFNLLWEDLQLKTKVVSFPEAVRMNLIKIAPQSKDEFVHILKETGIIPTKKKEASSSSVKIRDYQNMAVSSWVENQYQGILEMATGTGKTITAVHAYSEALKREEKLILLVTCPYAHLPIQWEKTIDRMSVRSEIRAILRADGTTVNWVDTIYRQSLELQNVTKRSKQKSLVILATNDTAASPKFRAMYEKIQAVYPFKWMIISDEVHSIGSTTHQKALYPEYEYRMGLSATPERYFDEAGSSALREYFGKTVFTFSLREAIDSTNPDTGVSYLVPYEYHVGFTTLTLAELERYKELTAKIVKIQSVIKDKKGKKREHEGLERLLMQRQDIVKNAENKFDVFIDMIQKLYDNDDLSHLLVYCSDSDSTQIKRVGAYLQNLSRQKKRFVKFHEYTSNESARVSKKTGYSERDVILKEFDKGNFEILLAMKCLDEGVDVPSTKSAILLCSSGNPKEYVQRRGRILRPYKGKDKAILYDIAALPPLNEETAGTAIESIIEKEKKRMQEFAKDSLNKPDIDLLIKEFLRQQGR